MATGSTVPAFQLRAGGLARAGEGRGEGKEDRHRVNKAEEQANLHERREGGASNSLVAAPVFAVTAHQKLGARVDENTLAGDALLAVGHLGRGRGVDLIDAGQGHIFLPVSDVQNVVEGLIGLKLAVDQDVGIQAEHLQEEEVAAGLEEVALDLLHGAEAEAAGGLVDDVEAHLAVHAAPRRHPPEVIEQGDQQGVLSPVLLLPHGADSRQASVAADVR